MVPPFVLKKRVARRDKESRGAPSPAGSSTAVPKTPGPTGAAHPSPTRLAKFDAVSLALLQVMCRAATQLLSLVGATPKWTNVWLVLEAGDGSAAAPYYGHIINCVTETDATKPSESDELCDHWWAFLCGTQGRRRAAQVGVVVAGGSGNNRDVGGSSGAAADIKDGDNKQHTRSGDEASTRGEGDQGGGDSSGDTASSGPSSYPGQSVLSRSAVKAITGRTLGTKTLSEDALAAVLFYGGLESVKEIT